MKKLKIASICGGILAALILTIAFTLQPNWELVFSEMDAATAAQIQDILAESGIRSRTDLAAGEISVPAGQVDAAHLAVIASPLFMQNFRFREIIGEMNLR